jgi:hypothetical protein
LGISEEDDNLHLPTTHPFLCSIQGLKPLVILLEDPAISCTTNLNIAKTPLPSSGPQTTNLVPTWKHFFLF